MVQVKQGVLGGVMALALGTVGCDRGVDTTRDTNQPMGTEQVDQAERSAQNEVRVADIVGAPETYMGRQVTVVADVEEVLGPRAFALDEDAPLAGGVDRELLVFSRQAAGLSDIDDQWLNNKVRVTGTVGRAALVEVEREVGWDLDPRLEAELEAAGAVLIAQSVERVDEAGE